MWEDNGAPLLAEVVTASGEVLVEQRMDGARIQVHRDGDDVRVWTRTLKEVTARVPELVAVVRAFPARQLVLDGETLALTDDGRPRPFQETAARCGADTHDLLLRPFFVDCLHVDGTDLVDEPLTVRQAALARVAPDHRLPGVARPSAEEAAAFLADALEAGHEGGAVLLRPELVVEIELDGGQRSTRYPGGVALRFARVLRYRPDKEPGDADTIDAVRALLPGRGRGRPVLGGG